MIKKAHWIIAGMMALAMVVNGAGLAQNTSEDSFTGITLTPARPVQAEPISMTMGDLHSLPSLTDAQLNVLADALDATPMQPYDEAVDGNFCSLQHPDWPPLPGNMQKLPVWPMQGFYLLNDLTFDYEALKKPKPVKGGKQMLAMSANLSVPGGGSGGGSMSPNIMSTFAVDTNQLWLEITNVSNGCSYLNLHNGTNLVYEILSKTNLLNASWTIEQALWPTDTNCQPFTVATLDRQMLFIRAKDWTGVDGNGNGLPDWWEWKYFGIINVNATNQDAYGNTMLFDYQQGLDPNAIVFSIRPIQYVNTTSPVLPLNIIGGTPFYMAVLVNDYDPADAVWMPYSTNLTANLSGGDGNYHIKVGLRGNAADSTATWRDVSLVLDTLSPVITITNPSTLVVSNTAINLQGFANETLSSVRFDVSNAGGIVTNRPGYLTGSYFDNNLSAYTTNYFTCPNVSLASGANWITIHATDLTGNTSVLNLTLNCAVDTSQPTLNVIWPTDGLVISGNNFSLQAQVNNPAAIIAATIVDASGNTNTVQGLVEGDGQVWVNNLPLGIGNNTVTVTAGLASGATASQTFSVVGNDVGLVIDPLTQLNQSKVTVTGSVGDPANDCVFVNGVQAYYPDESGDWEADNVPVSPGGTAVIKVEVYVGDPVLIGTQVRFVPQPATVQAMSYQLVEHNEFNSIIYWVYEDPTSHEITHGSYSDDGLEDIYINWRAGVGGTYQCVGFNDNWSGPFNLQSSYGPNPSDLQAAGCGLENAHVDVPSWSFTTVDGSPEWGSYQRQTSTQMQLLASGQQASGLTNVYLVRFAAVGLSYAVGNYSLDGTTWLPEVFQIGNQPLINTGQTNTSGANASGAVWGVTVVSAPAGQNVEVTPSFIHPPQGNWDYVFDEQAIQLYAPAVDNNRDGQITMDGSDATTPAKPFRFWVNNDHDGYDSSISDYDDMDPSIYGSDANNTSIPCTRDLEDYTRLWINTQGLTTDLQNGNLLLALEWKNTTGTPAIRLFPAVETNGGTLYLTDEATAQAQTNAPYGNCLNGGGVDELQGSLPFFISTNVLASLSADQPVVHLLFDAVSRGSGKLVVSIYKNDGVTKLAEGPPLYLKLQDVKEMYDRYTVGENPSSAPATTASLASGYSYDSTIPAENNYILFVHGWNMPTWEKDAFAETAFKRLYWQGYKGHFGEFRWPTGYGVSGLIQAIADADNYDNSEFNAWYSGTGLKNLLATLHSQYGNNVYLMAHSMGNVVAGEALKQAGANHLANTYVAMQGAVPAHCYDASMTIRTNLDDTFNNRLDLGYLSHTPNYYASYYTNGAPCYFNGTAGAGNYINFYNTQDWALSYWAVDEDLKPDIASGFSYNPVSNKFYAGDTEINFPTYTYEVFAYCDTAYCFALGAQANVGGPFLHDGSPQQIDLNATFDFGIEHKDHSGEFNSDNMNRLQFWQQFLISTKLTGPK